MSEFKPISLREAVVLKDLGEGGIQKLSLRVKNSGIKFGDDPELRVSFLIDIANKPVGATLRRYAFSLDSREEGLKKLTEERKQARIIRRVFADVLISRSEELRQNSPRYVDKS